MTKLKVETDNYFKWKLFQQQLFFTQKSEPESGGNQKSGSGGLQGALASFYIKE